MKNLTLKAISTLCKEVNLDSSRILDLIEREDLTVKIVEGKEVLYLFDEENEEADYAGSGIFIETLEMLTEEEIQKHFGDKEEYRNLESEATEIAEALGAFLKK